MIEIKAFYMMGEKNAPVSKSQMQREILLSLLADKNSTLVGNFASLPSDVMDALEVSKVLGAHWVLNENTLEISPPKERERKDHLELFVGESGFLFRSFLALGYLFAKRITFHVRGTLEKRTTDALRPSLQYFGCTCLSAPNAWPFELEYPRAIGKKCVVDASQTSQMASGFLMLAAALPHDFTVEMINPTSKPYLALTLDALANRGVNAACIDNHCAFVLGARIQGKAVAIEGDWSGAANVLAAAAISGNIRMTGLTLGSLQADEQILKVLQSYGADVHIDGHSIIVRSNHHACFQVDVTNCPDLFPLLCILAASAIGESTIMGIHRLYNKESNRLLSTCALLDKLGVSYEVLADAIQVRGGVSYKGDIVDSFDDHRIVLASYVARLLTKSPIVINDTRSIKKSYPTFVGDL